MLHNKDETNNHLNHFATELKHHYTSAAANHRCQEDDTYICTISEGLLYDVYSAKDMNRRANNMLRGL